MIGMLSMSARYCKEIAELYENQHNFEQAILYYDMAADLFQGEVTTSYQCMQKMAQYLAREGFYKGAIEIFVEIAKQCLINNLLKDRVRGHLLNAGICQLCEDDDVAMANALERYQELDPTFPGTREHGLLAELAAAREEVNFLRCNFAVEQYRMTEQGGLKSSFSARVALWIRELDADYDLT